MKKVNVISFAFLLLCLINQSGNAQIIYQHAYGTSTFSAVNPYTVTPNIIDPNLSSSQWSTSVAAGFTSFAGSAGQALSLGNSSGTPTYSLSFNVAPGYTCSITDYSFWRVRSSAGAQSWTLNVNGVTTIGSGTVPTTGTSTGTLAVSSPVNGLSGTVNVVLQLSGASGSGTFRLDDFTLYGTVGTTVTCTPPTLQASTFSVTSTSTGSVDVSWVAGNGGNVLMLASAGVPVSANPSSGSSYTANSVYGSGQQVGSGNYVVYDGAGTNAAITGLTPSTTYYFSVYEYNTSSGFPCYLTPGLTGSATTTGGACPTIQTSGFSTSAVANTSLTINWTPGDGGNALVVISPEAATLTPAGTYTAPSTVYGNGQLVGSGSYVVYAGTGSSVTVTNLNPGSTYYVYIFEYSAAGTPCYLSPALTQTVMPLATPISTTCLQIKSILVDACQASATNYESYNEMVYFKNGSNPLPVTQFSLAGAPRSGIYAMNKWPNPSNIWNGVVQNATTAANVFSVNASITNCGYVLEPPLVAGIGTIPPFANVILVGSQVMNPTSNSFANLTDTVYMIFQSASTTTAGNFVNYSGGNIGTRGLVLIDGANGCTSNTVTYEPQLLLNHADGDGVSYNENNTVSYYNSGCQAPFTPLSVKASNNQKICFDGSSVLTATPSGVYNSITWSGGTGTFSNPSALTTTYTAGAGDSGPVQIFCTITRSCSASSTSAKDTVVISVIHPPVATINASNGFSLCPSATSVISYSVTNANVADIVTPSWTSPAGSGTTYTVSSPSGTASVNYTLNLSNMCGSSTHTFDVFPLAAPSVSLSANTLTACPGNTMSLTATSNSGNYSWNNPVSTNSTVIITASTSTTGVVTTTNSCGSAQDTYTLSVTPNASLLVDNSNVVLCAGQSATITATSNTGTYTWTPDAVNTNTIMVNSNGTHTVTTSNACNTASAVVNVTVNATPVLAISATSESVCVNGTTSSILSLNGSTGSYTWSTGVNTSTILVTSPGTYTATVDAGTCGTATASIDITPIATPTISAVSSSSLICDGATATLTANSNISNYGWSTGETSVSTITVNITNTYTVGVSNACGTASASINVVALNTPVLNLTASSTTICPNETTTLTVSGGTEPYVWSNSANTTSVNTVSTGGTVSVMNSNACGADTKTIMINVIPNPTITLSQSSYTVCEGDAVSVVANSSEGNYSWLPFTNTTNTLTFTPSASTTGMVTTTNVCTSVSDTYSIIVISSPTIVVTPSLTSVCPGQSVTLTADSDVPMYTWQPGGATTNTLLASGGGYTVSTSNVCFTVSATSSVQVNSSPTLTISASSPSICSNGSAVSTLSLTGSAGTYSWSNGATDYTTSISSPGIYTATVTTAGCGTAPASITIDAIPDPTISVVATSTLLCNGQTATLTASSDMSNFSWSTGQIITPSITVNSTNTYTVGVSNSCKTVTTSINVVADNTPTLNLTTSSTTLCPNETAILTVTGGIEPYTWSNTSSTGSVVTTSGGTVTVTYSNVCGTDIKSVVVVISNLSADIAANPQSGVVPVQVDYTNNSVGATTYTWNFGNSNTATTQTVSAQTYSNVGEYYAYLLVSDGVCFDKDSVLINVLDIEPIFEIPNVFTPNADSVNDIFMIKKYYHIVDLNCTIYDRWGLQMYSWEGINYGWDGKSDGKDVPAGTYFYIINAKDIDGKEIKKQGSVNLFR